MSATDCREELRSRGWSDDVDTRRDRRPRQKIDAAERENSGGSLTITPSWIYACTECGEERRIAAEDVATWAHCDTCGEVQSFEPLGELHYPGTDDCGYHELIEDLEALIDEWKGRSSAHGYVNANTYNRAADKIQEAIDDAE